jgi:glycosyltransferase involved in cell wall biosynthesis
LRFIDDMTRRLRILHYTGVYAPAWSYGGPPRSVSSLCEGLAALGHEVTVFTTNAGLQDRADIPTDRPVDRAGVTVRYFPAAFGRMGLGSPALEAAVGSSVGDYDLIHVTGVWQPTSVAACRAAETADVPYFVSPRGALGRYSFTQRPWKKWPYWWLQERCNVARAAAIHCTSALEAEECGRFGLTPPRFVVPNSIDLAAWQRNDEGGQAWRSGLGCAHDEAVYLFVGRLHDKKGLDLLPAVLTQLKDLKWRMVFVGPDEDGSGVRLQAAFAAAGLTERVVFQRASDTDDLVRAYSGADLFLFPSRHENFGNVAVEALRCGCPVILSDQVGVASELAGRPDVSSLPRSAERWATAIRRATSSLPATAAGEGIVERFSPAAIAGRMLSEYQKHAVAR